MPGWQQRRGCVTGAAAGVDKSSPTPVGNLYGAGGGGKVVESGRVLERDGCGGWCGGNRTSFVRARPKCQVWRGTAMCFSIQVWSLASSASEWGA